MNFHFLLPDLLGFQNLIHAAVKLPQVGVMTVSIWDYRLSLHSKKGGIDKKGASEIGGSRKEKALRLCNFILSTMGENLG
jgi:hypothetical protein